MFFEKVLENEKELPLFVVNLTKAINKVIKDIIMGYKESLYKKTRSVRFFNFTSREIEITLHIFQI